MKRPLAYITASWYGGDSENAERAARYCRAVYEAGYAPICPALFLPLFLNDPVPQEHKDGLDMARDLLRRSRVLEREAALRHFVPKHFLYLFPRRLSVRTWLWLIYPPSPPLRKHRRERPVKGASGPAVARRPCP